MKLLLLSYFATWLLIPHILLAGKRPLSTLAWIWAVLLFPFLGPLAYLLLGIDRVTRERVRLHGWSRREKASCADQKETEARDATLFRALGRISDTPPTSISDLRLLADAATFYPALEQRIAGARHHAHIEFFVWQDDAHGRRIRDLLIAAARRGVEVRVLIDRIGSLRTKRRFFQPLREAGGQFAWFRSINPLRRHFSIHLRNHRKIQVIDGEIAFIGGMNIGREYASEETDIGSWRDLQVELRGSVVAVLQNVFAKDWYFATEEKIEDATYYAAERTVGRHPAQVILGGPDLTCEAMAESFFAVLNHATARAWIATGYFVPDSLLLATLRLAAARGVDVRLLNTQKSDHPWFAEIGRSYYEQLMEAGVRIFEYAAGLHHAKAVLLDDAWVMIGSANCDNRSMRLNFEASVLVHSTDAAASLEAIFREDFAASQEITLETFRQRPFQRRLIEAAVRPFAPMI